MRKIKLNDAPILDSSLKNDRAPIERPDPSRNIAALTGLRFFAAISIVIYHFHGAVFESLGNNWLTGLFTVGSMGVSMFFVLSGFVLTHVYINGKSKPVAAKSFFVARFARIYPAYALALLLEVPALIWLVFNSSDVVRRGLIFSGSLIANLLLLQAWARVASWRWNFPSWSVSAEAFFYSIFPTIANRLKLHDISGRVLLCMLLGCAAIMPVPALTATYVAHAPQVAETPVSNLLLFFPLLRVPEFLAGIFLGLLMMKVERRWRSEIIRRVGAIALTTGVAAIAVIAQFSLEIPLLLRDSFFTLPFVLMIFGIAVDRGVLAAFLSMPLLVLLGEASYGIYIYQAPIYEVLRSDLLAQWFGGTDSLAKALASMLVLILFSILAHKRFELPVRDWINARWRLRDRSKIAVGPVR